jgi:hypothetical protein
VSAVNSGSGGLSDWWTIIRPTTDGGYIEAGRFGGRPEGSWVIKYRADGTVQFNTGRLNFSVGTSFTGGVADLIEVADGYIVLSFGTGLTSMMVNKLDYNGNSVWFTDIPHQNNLTGYAYIGTLCVSPQGNPVIINNIDNTACFKSC